MPKSKRSKVGEYRISHDKDYAHSYVLVSLTKVAKKTKEQKGALIQEVSLTHTKDNVVLN